MKPIVTIFETINQSGIDQLDKFADITIAYGATRSEQLNLSRKSDVIIVKSVVRVDKELLDNSPSLRIIARAGTGVDNIDISEAERQQVKVLTVPTGNSVSAAEYTLLQILFLSRRMLEVQRFTANKDYRRHLLEGNEIINMTVGLVGLGNVGMLVFERLKSFGCRVLGYDPYAKKIEKFVSDGGSYYESFDNFLKEVDIISFHTRLTSENFHMMGKYQFNLVKPGLLLVNTARAELINQEELLESMNNGQVSAAAIDVISPEPPFDSKPEEHDFHHILLSHPKIHVTPHIGASTIDAQNRISIDICNQIIDNWSEK